MKHLLLLLGCCWLLAFGATAAPLPVTVVRDTAEWTWLYQDAQVLPVPAGLTLAQVQSARWAGQWRPMLKAEVPATAQDLWLRCAFRSGTGTTSSWPFEL